MTFTSYAQNFEDVMLWRALSHIKNGAYVDVGAQDPVVDSVSLAFHERGWRGVHVEPSHGYAELLRQQRPGDLVIEAAVGDGPQLLKFYETPGGGISTADPEIAAQHKARGIFVRETVVSCVSLSSVFDASPSAEIHWLKIDAEGYELQILKSWGKSQARPWVVVIESTIPLTQIDVHEAWEPLVLERGYRFVYFDGLNRYYISSLHPELDGAFRTPPNVFDNFALNGTSTAEFHKLIGSRFQAKIDETLAKSETLQDSARGEIERLNISISASLRRHVRIRRRIQLFWKSLVAREQALGERLVGELAEIREFHSKAVSVSEARERVYATRLAESDTKVQKQQAELRQFETQLSESKSKEREALLAQASLRASLGMARGRVSEAEEEVTSVRSRLLEMGSRIASTDKELVEVREQLRRRECEHAESINRLSHLQEAIASKDRDLLEAREQLRRREQLHAESNERLASILDSVRSRAENDAKASICDKAALEHALAALKVSLATAEQQAAVKETECASFELHLRRLQEYPPIRMLMRLRRIPLRESADFEHLVGTGVVQRSTEPPLAISDASAVRRGQLDATENGVVRRPADQQSERPIMEKILHANQLLNLSGAAFVRSAYEAILGRAPDSAGGAYYLRRLQTEQDRVKILYELATSKEGRKKANALPGLAELILPNRLKRVFLIRWLQNFLGIGQQFARVEAMVANVSEECRAQLRSVETQLVSLSNACEKLAGSDRIETTVSATRELDRRQSLPAALDSVLTAEDGPDGLLKSLTAQLGGSAQAHILSKK